MSKAFALPAAIVVAALPAAASAQSRPPQPPVFAPPGPPPLNPPPRQPLPPPSYDMSKWGPQGDPASWYPDDYNMMGMVRTTERGRVILQLRINMSGHSGHCAIVGSSGSASLDDTACRLMTRRGYYYQARDGRGGAADYQWQLTLDLDLDPSRTQPAKIKVVRSTRASGPLPNY